VPLTAGEAECLGHLFELFDEPVGGGVGSESFSVAVPEFDVSGATGEEFY